MNFTGSLNKKDYKVSIGDVDYYVDIYATCEGYDDPGDYWTPPDSEFDIIDLEVTNVRTHDEDCNEVQVTNPNTIEEVKDIIETILYDNQDMFDYSNGYFIKED